MLPKPLASFSDGLMAGPMIGVSLSQAIPIAKAVLPIFRPSSLDFR